jgi:CheY-like chemotaxis protein
MWGHQVGIASDGVSALARVDEFHPHVVLLDIALPKMDGCAVARHLRQLPHLDPLLIVGISGLGQPADSRRAVESCCDHYLIKPVEPELLRELIASWRAQPKSNSTSSCQANLAPPKELS